MRFTEYYLKEVKSYLLHTLLMIRFNLSIKSQQKDQLQLLETVCMMSMEGLGRQLLLKLHTHRN